MEENEGKNGKTGWFTRLGYDNTIINPASVVGKLMSKVNKTLEGSTAPMGFQTLLMEGG